MADGGVTHHWMVVGEGIVNIHILKEPLDMLLKESFDLVVVVF